MCGAMNSVLLIKLIKLALCVAGHQIYLSQEAICYKNLVFYKLLIFTRIIKIHHIYFCYYFNIYL